MSFTLHTEETTNAPTKQEWMSWGICDCCGIDFKSLFIDHKGEVLCDECLKNKYTTDMTFEKYQI